MSSNRIHNIEKTENYNKMSIHTLRNIENSNTSRNFGTFAFSLKENIVRLQIGAFH